MRAKFKGTIIQSTEIVIMLQFLGPEMESSISQIFRPRNCGNAAMYFWAMLQFLGPEIAVMLERSFMDQLQSFENIYISP